MLDANARSGEMILYRIHQKARDRHASGACGACKRTIQKQGRSNRVAKETMLPQARLNLFFLFVEIVLVLTFNLIVGCV